MSQKRYALASVIGATAIVATFGGWASTAQAFTLSSSSAGFDNVLLNNGTLVGTDGDAASSINKVEFLDLNGEQQVRWGSPVYGTEVTTTQWQNGYWKEDGHWGYDCIEYRRSGSCRKWDYTWIDTSYWVEGKWIETTETVYTSENKSGLGFAGVQNLDIKANEVFNIGTLKHFNQTIWGDGLAGTKTDFSLSLTFGEQLIGEQTFNFALHIDETNNDPGSHTGGVCPYETDSGKGCSDKITWSFDLEQTHTFDYGGDQYTLELVIFSENMDTSTVTERFISQEKGTSEASLWARVIKVPSDRQEVPEPTALLGLAALGTYLIKSRSRTAVSGQVA